ncbi:uncharacterized protein LOC143905729 [Temnothorax americanus]|uniref:uncharacterized protein LOC143905729 n=1 Tax=Temnothorax americanus TaxID=1964332 RepID=UPI0040693FF6
MIRDFPVEPMHLIDLGVTKAVVSMWCFGKPSVKLSHAQVTQISGLLINQIKNIPLEFNRTPRSLEESRRWKATEFRQFLLYTGPVVLKSVLNRDNYLNFMSLNVAVTILSSLHHVRYLDYANSLLNYFVKSYIILYGKDNCSINIHNLLHLCDDVKKFGMLQEYSAYPFENHMQKIKGYIRKKDKPLQQIVNRIYEENFAELSEENNLNVKPKLFNKHDNGPLNQFLCNSQWEKIVFSNFTLKIKDPNNCCSLNNGDIVLIKNIASNNKNIVIIGNKYNSKKDFYNEPCNSSDLGIYLVDNVVNDLQSWNISEISHKCIRLHFKDKFVIFPLLHSASN